MEKRSKRAQKYKVTYSSALPRVTSSTFAHSRRKGKTVKRRTGNVTQTDHTSRGSVWDSNFQIEDIWMPNFDPPEEVEGPTPPLITGTRRTGKTQQDFVNEWREHESTYLSILLDHETLPFGPCLCACGSGHTAEFVCDNCCGKASHCKQCILATHSRMPLHRIRKWNGNFLEVTSLSSLGLSISFGHGGNACPVARATHTLAAFHIDGFHTISVVFCHCESSPAPHFQLFNNKLFPASFDNPKTVFTFELLRQFRIHHLEGKGSAYSYINSLYRLTNDAGSLENPGRVREFRRVARQWNYLQVLKHSGAYGSTSLISHMATECPACPRPGINIPENWREIIPGSLYYLIRCYVHFDANFRLVQLRRDARNPSDRALWIGGGFFADPEEYEDYLGVVDHEQQETSDCADHRATTLSTRTRFNRLEVTGVAGAVCRHECAIPQGFVNLYKGERYVNSDFAISHILRGMIGICEVIVSYDIACQYQRNFQTRFRQLPATLLLPLQLAIIFLIPKFHLPVHKEECRYKYSFNYAKKVGRTDGEAIERFWGSHNHLSGSTMRMTSGSRLDTLNFHFNDWNWRKTCKMGATLVERHLHAKEMKAEHETLLADLAVGIGEAKAEEWTRQEDEFVLQPGARSIYQPVTDNAPTRAQILQRLTQFDAPGMNEAVGQDHEQPALVFWVNDGIELEEAQARLRVHALTIDDGSTDRERIQLNRRRVSMLERVNAWKARAPDGVPEDAEEEYQDELPEYLPLALPSSLPPQNQNAILQDIERHLREGCAFDSLRALRKCLAERVALQREKDRNIRGQAANFRSQAAINRLQAEIKFVAGRYRAAYAALQSLGGDINPELAALADEDISAAKIFEYTRQLGRGYNNTLSWIWRQTGFGAQAGDDNWLEEVLRVQFLEAKVNRDRWSEECEMTMAELRLTRGTFQYKQQWWTDKALIADTEGAAAHARSMAAMYDVMAQQITQKIEAIVAVA